MKSTGWHKIKQGIKRLETKEEEMIRLENPERYYLLKELEETGQISDPKGESFEDASFVDNFMRKHSG